MSQPQADLLTPILERKRREVARRKAHGALARAVREELLSVTTDRGAQAADALRRAPGEPPRVIAEIKRMSPSAGVIRPRRVHDVIDIARAYEAGGAAAISVLCDGAGFGGSVLDLRRAARAVRVPTLFKEFVVDEEQVELARCMGAHMVLLLVRALPPERLDALVSHVSRLGMAPLVEAADEAELDVALATSASLIGVNARDLRTFRVDPEAARRALARIGRERIAIHMSGVQSPEAFAQVASGRADAVLIGEGLMRAPDPGARLSELLCRR